MPIAIPSVSFRAPITSTGLNTAFSTLGTEINRVGGLIDGATPTITANTNAIAAALSASGGAAGSGKLVKWGSTGELNASSYQTNLTTATQGLTMIGVATQTLPYINVQDNLGANVLIIAASKAAVFGSTVQSVGGFIGNLTGNVTGNVSGTAGSTAALTNPVALTNLISDYKAIPSVSAGQITIQAGGAYRDSALNSIGPLGQQTVNLPAQPSGTNSQWVAISLAPSTGGPVATAGAVASSSPVKPQFPDGNFADAMVLWKGATTNPSGVVAAADIIDHRNFGSGGGGTGGGTGGAPTSGQYWISGANVSLPSALDATNAATNSFMSASLIRPALAQISVADVLGSFVSANAMLSLQASGAALALTILNDPIVMGTNGVWNKIATSLTTSNTAGSAGVYKLVATLTAAGTTPTLRLTQGSLLTNEIEIANAYYDGSAWQLYLVWWPPFQQLTANGVPVSEATGFAQIWGGTSAALVTASYLPPSTIATQFLFLPTPLKVRYRYEGTVSSSVAATRAELAVAIDSTTTISDLIWSDGQAVNTWNTISGTYEPASPLGIGGHQFLLLARGYNNSTFAAQSTTYQRLKFATELFRG